MPTGKYVKYFHLHSCVSQFCQICRMLERPARAWPRNKEDKNWGRLRKMDEGEEKEKKQLIPIRVLEINK